MSKKKGAHVRACMGDRRWSLLPLSARAAWLELTDIADLMPELRAPSMAIAVTASDLPRLLACAETEIPDVIAALTRQSIVSTDHNGAIRLKAY